MKMTDLWYIIENPLYLTISGSMKSLIHFLCIDINGLQNQLTYHYNHRVKYSQLVVVDFYVNDRNYKYTGVILSSHMHFYGEI